MLFLQISLLLTLLPCGDSKNGKNSVQKDVCERMCVCVCACMHAGTSTCLSLCVWMCGMHVCMEWLPQPRDWEYQPSFIPVSLTPDPCALLKAIYYVWVPGAAKYLLRYLAFPLNSEFRLFCTFLSLFSLLPSAPSHSLCSFSRFTGANHFPNHSDLIIL